MNINETPPRAPRRLELSARRARVLDIIGDSDVAPPTGESDAPRAAPLSVVGEVIASLYVAVARRVLLGVEALEDRRAAARPAVSNDPVAAAARNDEK